MLLCTVCLSKTGIVGENYLHSNSFFLIDLFFKLLSYLTRSLSGVTMPILRYTFSLQNTATLPYLHIVEADSTCPIR
jgi:hypothetical protein